MDSSRASTFPGRRRGKGQEHGEPQGVGIGKNKDGRQPTRIGQNWAVCRVPDD
ncbi:hypothetical protein FRUB_10599 [Fimbriiglobus ruber]|uniref:Uncharacterized protein n=1 Tax=Fimbriiglobus ruber TaxID=1908690 RepID=A0A225D7V5_9BACT|nr:hypothetical protein FRUB_10599 [Fimbriiglobus ruber]